jgi:hypothetical protein
MRHDKKLGLTLDFTVDFHITGHLSTQKLYAVDRSSSADDFGPFTRHSLSRKPIADKKHNLLLKHGSDLS